MEDFIRANFDIRTVEGEEEFMSRDVPESWTNLNAFLSMFDSVEPTYEALSAAVGQTGFQQIFDEWLARGLFN